VFWAARRRGRWRRGRRRAHLSRWLPYRFAAWGPTSLALLDELRLAGFIEGQNLIVLEDGIGVADSRLATAAAAVVKAAPDAIFAPGFVQAKAAQMATKTIPILALSEDMIADGLVSSIARPDGNTTGISLLSPDLDGKRGDLLLDAYLACAMSRCSPIRMSTSLRTFRP
jgi:putative ABC transport system substrate-binding protein